MKNDKQKTAKGEALYRQIASDLRKKIEDSVFPPGSQLPKVREIAADWNSTTFTAQKAVSTLVKSGLVTASPKLGIFVREQAPNLHCVGIYHANDITLHELNHTRYFIQLYIQKKLADRGVKTLVWMDPRDEEGRKKPLAELSQTVKDGEIQSIICPLIDKQCLPWLRRISLPLSYMGDNDGQGLVDFRKNEGIELAIKHFKNLGCRRIAMLCPDDLLDTKGYNSYQKAFTKLAGEYGLEVRDEWCRTLPWDYDFRATGYKLFHNLWTCQERPDGLYLTPDALASGAITAMLEKGVEAPKQLKLISHRNSEMDFFCPFPHTELQASVEDIADALIGQMDRQLEGKDSPPLRLGLSLCQIEESSGDMVLTA